MIKKTIKYTDYDGNVREEDFYFNLNKAELTKLQASEEGGYGEMLKKLVADKDVKNIVKVFEDIIKLSYGKKSEDGKRFIKSADITDEFLQTEAYSELFMDIASSEQKASEFISGLLPADLREQIAKQQTNAQN